MTDLFEGSTLRRLCLVVAFAPLALSCSPGFGRVCTMATCQSGVTVVFSTPLREKGAYTFRLELDGEPVTCKTALPFSACPAASACSAPSAVLWTSNCTPPADQHALIGVRVASVPGTVRVTIERDGARVASETFTPSYVRSQPNGEGCGPVCDNADVSLAAH